MPGQWSMSSHTWYALDDDCVQHTESARSGHVCFVQSGTQKVYAYRYITRADLNAGLSYNKCPVSTQELRGRNK